ncbi:MAG: hypothetical protein WCA35_20520 [Kovacikia sp.]
MSKTQRNHSAIQQCRGFERSPRVYDWKIKVSDRPPISKQALAYQLHSQAG